MKEILVSDQIIQVDDEDYPFLTTCYNLEIDINGYVYCRLNTKYKRKRMGLYTRLSLQKLLVAPDRKGREHVVDHKDHNKLNNQKDNLRPCTHTENMRNRNIQTKYAGEDKVSKYKGVTWNKGKGVWEVRVSNGERYLYFGSFSNEKAAANCYNYYSNDIYGEFAKPNEVDFMSKSEWEGYQKRKNKTSKYIGVSLISGKWKAQIWDGKNNIALGYFDDEIEAVNTYNQKAIELKGEKAKINIIQNKANEKQDLL